MFEEMKALYPITTDVKQMQEQHEATIVQGFLAGLDFEYDMAHTQLLTGSELPGKLSDVFSLLQRVCKEVGKDASVRESTAFASSTSQTDSNRGGRSGTRGSRGGGRDGGRDSSCTCHRCGEPGHIKKN